MDYALELLFDKRATNLIMSLWAILTKEGLRRSVEGDPKYPHLSLYVWQSLPSQTFNPAFSNLARSPNQGLQDITLDRTDFFFGPSSVLYLAPRHNPSLFDLHKRWLASLMDTASTVLSTYLPGNWVPHVTLADHLTNEELDRAKNLVSLERSILAVPSDVVLVQIHPKATWVSEYYPLTSANAEQTTWFRFNEALRTHRHFEAHEILEALWRQNHDKKVQTAIWLAALFTHWSRGQYPGALKILEKILNSPVGYPNELRPVLHTWQLSLKTGSPMPDIQAFERMILIRWARST